MMENRQIKIIVLSFLAVILSGAFLLMLPISHYGQLSLIDALFTATSAVCVTGLVVKNTPVDFTIFGQTTILLLIQLGGLGYMTAATFLAVIFKKKLAVRDRLMLKESLNYPGISGIVRFLKIVFLTVIGFEVIGAFILTFRFSFDMPFLQALWFGFFHSISAFNNAGFSLFEDNLMRYRGDIIVNLTITSLIILGGLGYFVIMEIYSYRNKEIFRLSTHTKLVLWVSGFLILACMFMLLTLEWFNPKTLGNLSVIDKIIASWFTSVNYRTAGFNTIDLSGLTDANLFFGTIFMIIGGSPGSTAGGIKTTVFAVLMIAVWHTLRGNDRPHIFNRSIPQSTINKAMAALIIASMYTVLSSIMLTEVEKLNFLRTLFEVCSAFGTVGVSTGNGGVLSYSALFSDFGKLNIILLMIVGRVGVLAFTLAVVGQALESRIKYSEGKVIL